MAPSQTTITAWYYKQLSRDMETYTRQGITEHILTRFVTPLPLD